MNNSMRIVTIKMVMLHDYCDPDCSAYLNSADFSRFKMNDLKIPSTEVLVRSGHRLISMLWLLNKISLLL